MPTQLLLEKLFIKACPVPILVQASLDNMLAAMKFAIISQSLLIWVIPAGVTTFITILVKLRRLAQVFEQPYRFATTGVKFQVCLVNYDICIEHGTSVVPELICRAHTIGDVLAWHQQSRGLERLKRPWLEWRTQTQWCAPWKSGIWTSSSEFILSVTMDRINLIKTLTPFSESQRQLYQRLTIITTSAASLIMRHYQFVCAGARSVRPQWIAYLASRTSFARRRGAVAHYHQAVSVADNSGSSIAASSHTAISLLSRESQAPEKNDPVPWNRRFDESLTDEPTVLCRYQRTKYLDCPVISSSCL